MMPITENLTAADVTVIVSLWVLRFYDACFQTLVKHTSEVFHGDFVKSESFEAYSVALLFCKSVLAYLVAFFVDAYNHKYRVVLWGMVSFGLTAVLALCMCLTRNVTFVWLTMAASSLLFVVQPVVFGLIFNQKQHPVPRQVRKLVSVMEFVEALLLFVIKEIIADTAVQSERYSMIASWVIVISFIIFIVTILERIRKYVSPDRVKEDGVAAIFEGLRHDLSGKPPHSGLGKLNVLFFALLLLPAFSLSSLKSVISNIKSENDTQFQHRSVNRIIGFSQLTAIPLTEVVVSYVPIRELLAEMAVLGLAHIMNIGVLTLLVFRIMFRSGGSGQRSAAVSAYEEFPENQTLQNSAESTHLKTNSLGMRHLLAFPKSKRLSRQIHEKSFAIMILNPTLLNVSLAGDPPRTILDSRIRILPPQIGFFSREVQITGKDITVTMTFTTTPTGPNLTKTVKFKEKNVYFIRLTEAPTFDIVISGGDIAYPETVTTPILVVFNGFVGGEYWAKRLGLDHEFQIRTRTGSTIFIETLPDRTETLQAEVPAGKLRLTVRYKGTDPFMGQKFGTPGEGEIDVRPWSVNVIAIAIALSTNQLAFYTFSPILEFYQSQPPVPTAAPPEPEKPDAALQTVFTMVGTVLGLTSVGYIHFFWTGSPARLRSTLYACFLTSNEITGWMASQIVGHEISLREGVGLLIIAILTGTWHFVFGWYYESKIMAKTNQK